MRSSRMRHGIGRRGLLAGASGLLTSPSIVRAQAQNGVALVIGNSKYKWEASLPNVRRDAPDMAKRFKALGLQTALIQDASLDAMRQAIEQFKSAARGANFAAFYFAGHGAAWGKDTYFVPVDADLGTPSVVQSLMPVPSIGGAMQEANNRLLVFDNCRNNPADGWRQLETVRSAAYDPGRQQASDIGLGPNTLVLYSTAPGRVALDGPAGENSPFAAMLLRHLDGQSVDLQALPTKLRRDLLIATEGRQVLWDQNGYERRFVLNANRTGQSAPAGGRSGESHDPARIIELHKAYAFVRENNLPLPEGLIAFRAPAHSRDAHKVGAFKHTATGPTGRDARLLLILSVDEQRVAEVIVAGRGGKGVFWRFVTATCSGDRLEVVSRGEGANFVFDWSDANSGSVAEIRESGGKRGAGSSRFTRLDG